MLTKDETMIIIDVLNVVINKENERISKLKERGITYEIDKNNDLKNIREKLRKYYDMRET